MPPCSPWRRSASLRLLLTSPFWKRWEMSEKEHTRISHAYSWLIGLVAMFRIIWCNQSRLVVSQHVLSMSMCRDTSFERTKACTLPKSNISCRWMCWNQFSDVRASWGASPFERFRLRFITPLLTKSGPCRIWMSFALLELICRYICATLFHS